MIRRQHFFKLFVALAVAASISVVGARSAKATERPYNAHASAYGGARFASAEHRLKAARAHDRTLITDTLGGNGRPRVEPSASGSTRFVAL